MCLYGFTWIHKVLYWFYMVLYCFISTYIQAQPTTYKQKQQ